MSNPSAFPASHRSPKLRRSPYDTDGYSTRERPADYHCRPRGPTGETPGAVTNHGFFMIN